MGGSRLYVNTEIIFGEKSIRHLKRIIPENKKVLILTGKQSAIRFGHLTKILKELEAHRIKCFVFNNISPNPKVSEIDTAVRVAKENEVEILIGLGGGSVLDAAKATAAMYYVNGFTEEVLNGAKDLTQRRLGLIQIPTTAGTGSELSMGAIVTDEKSGVKDGLRGEVLLADIAIVDPELTYTAPLQLTIETGFDIMTHAIETFLSRKSSQLTKFQSIQACKKVFHYLPLLAIDLSNQAARRELSYASLIMGINLANSSTCLPHRLQYPIGALTDTSHPRGLAALYPAWLELYLYYDRAGLRELALQLNFDDDDTLAEEQLYKYIIQFMSDLRLDLRLKDLGIYEKDIPVMLGKLRGSLTNDPIGGIKDIAELIYRKSL
ncbi:iron-containing alcohol dehydrogenase [Cohnella thailandensis]|uniref:Iron-containing alcohol dehydrogenase n=1 Tax=Cohnella thailandensis TaxID=557557 RepID=A0A841SR04_9BACL|nr:iron-containing alcohol dehydrogenase [Cohnella thailandensis]MBB6632578.1 iron-containing alcohol dehydrogenase [Cohnella thailandensis]MBP1971872.1 alcohol dehydrogenase class IV [Cohnella thailandensis]